MTESVTYQVPNRGGTDLWSLTAGWPLPRDKQRMLIAVASSGGERVDGDFEDAEIFLLYEKTARQTAYVGRQSCPLTAAGADPARRTWLLADCDLVLCANITDSCRQTLSSLGVDCKLAYAGVTVADAVAGL
jgi:predicted Fe-Mo cluster-binding NifX family protein